MIEWYLRASFENDREDAQTVGFHLYKKEGDKIIVYIGTEEISGSADDAHGIPSRAFKILESDAEAMLKWNFRKIVLRDLKKQLPERYI